MFGKYILEYWGLYKGVICYLLVLKVFEFKEKCCICVGNEICYWEEGKSMIFDDFFFYEVWNEIDGVCVVLFLDVMRLMGFLLLFLNELMMKIIVIIFYI